MITLSYNAHGTKKETERQKMNAPHEKEGSGSGADRHTEFQKQINQRWWLLFLHLNAAFSSTVTF
ncbi:hypothetical protein T12_9966 [Trichinella patagoniensis]|uniref:Uncharacterized protein n=1 Tax=Trichinella patagoniensis TaxID=990121 RepID=A0A0V1A3R5_9BILA|nr:hypothetical protein T12_9966 [Trichinella patagoniensis]